MMAKLERVDEQQRDDGAEESRVHFLIATLLKGGVATGCRKDRTLLEHFIRRGEVRCVRPQQPPVGCDRGNRALARHAAAF